MSKIICKKNQIKEHTSDFKRKFQMIKSVRQKRAMEGELDEKLPKDTYESCYPVVYLDAIHTLQCIALPPMAPKLCTERNNMPHLF